MIISIVNKNLKAATFALHTGKGILQIAAVEITIDHLLEVMAPEAPDMEMLMNESAIENK